MGYTIRLRSVYKHLKRNLKAGALVAILVISVFIPGLTALKAVGQYDNANIADRALAQIGQYMGQCRTFVNNIVASASSGSQNTSTTNAGGDYFQSFINAGGTQITDINSLTKGDIIQIGQYVSSPGLHTFIIVSRDVDGLFWVVDSNSQNNNGIVRNYKRSAFSLSSTTRAFRMGTVMGQTSVTPMAVVNNTSNGLLWYIRNAHNSGDTSVPPFYYGGTGLEPLMGDWNNDGTDTIGAFNPSTATFYLRNSNTPGDPDAGVIQFGAGGWVPVVGDWDGNGTDTIGAFNPSTATFYLRNSNTPGDPDAGVIQFGAGGWVPVVGDWDGNGTDTIGAVARTSSGLLWYLRNSNSGGNPDIPPFYYGGQYLKPISGNWDNVGGDTVGAIDNTSSGLLWYLRNSNNSGNPDTSPYYYGGSGLIPVK